MKKWNKFNSKKRWKNPSILSLVFLFTVILIVPTLIVLPFVQSDNVEKASVNKKTEAAAVFNESSSPFSVEVLRTQTEQVETVPLETYVARVVSSEMPAEFELEALKAQALAARTYVVNYMTHMEEGSLPEGSDVTDTIQHQVYKNEKELKSLWGADYNKKISKIKKAVAATKGEILTYDGNPITPAFFSTSNGYTENSEDYWKNKLPYLRSVESPWDKKSPKYLDQEVFTLEKVEQKLGVSIEAASDNVATMSRTESERVANITIGDKKFTGREVREKLGLRSSDFDIEQKNNHLIFTTKGFGHGIGMSQYGANGMAEEGKSYKDIVQHYYKGIKIDKVTSTVPKLAAK